jgi:phage protein D
MLMPRDPHSLFAYWDIDWREVFPEERPQERKVRLRVLDEAGAEVRVLEIEAMAGTCYVEVPEGGASYSGEIGYVGAEGEWVPVAEAEPVITPPDELTDGDATDFATVPFHLSFQRMIDLLRVTKHEHGSLTELLGTLREQAAAPQENSVLTPEQREFARVLEQASVSTAIAAEEASRPDLWVQQKLQRVLGFGATSPAEGFGGSSRPA